MAEVHEMKSGSIVKLTNPTSDAEKTARFILLDDPQLHNRVDIQLICDLPFAPIERVSKDEITQVEE